jgi:UDP-glucuronate 4-epimerase
MLEAARASERISHFVYASSSSVYGDSTALPFNLNDPVDKPRSLYGATKRSDELIARSYAALFAMPLTGLRFFTVYGPWGRPDMSAFIFAKAILSGQPITLFNNGDMKRDFTFVDDIVSGVLSALDRPSNVANEGGVPHRIYNLGNHRSEPLRRFVELIEHACGRKAIVQYAPMQPGDVVETYADIEDARRDLGFEPRTSIQEGVPKFVSWFREYHKNS